MPCEFDAPGLNQARRLLTSLAKAPKASYAGQNIKLALIKALYPEIRAARLAGYSWRSIHKTLREANAQPHMSLNLMCDYFCAIDKQYEKETGVKALPREGYNYRGARKKKKIPDDTAEPPIEITA